MICPDCNSKSVATHVHRYPDGSESRHGYCPNCEPPFFPPLPSGYSPWDADWSKHTELHETETVKDRLEKFLQGEGPQPA